MARHRFSDFVISQMANMMMAQITKANTTHLIGDQGLAPAFTQV